MRLVTLILIASLGLPAASAQAQSQQTYESLAQVLATGSLGERRQAAADLIDLNDPRAVRPLITALEDEDLTVRRLTAQGLGSYRAYLAVMPLIETALNPDSGAQEDAVQALREIDVDGEFRTVVAALNDELPNVRRFAAMTLGALQVETAVEELLQVADDPNISVRNGVIDGLAMMAPQIQDQLIAFLASPDASDLARVTVLHGIAVSRPTYRPDADLSRALMDQIQIGSPEVGIAAAKAMRQCADPSILVRLMQRFNQLGGRSLSESEIILRASIAEAFGRIWNRTTIGTLLRVVESDAEPVLVRQYSAIALARIGDTRAAVPLASLMLHGDPILQVVAAEAVNRVYHRDAAPTLVEVFALQDPLLTKAATKGLLRIGRDSAAALLDGRLHESEAVRAACYAIWDELGITYADLVRLGVLPPEDEGDIPPGERTPPPAMVVPTVPADVQAYYVETAQRAREAIERENAGQ